MVLSPTDLPLPVEPAMSRCGIAARSAITELPVVSLPSASGSRALLVDELLADQDLAEVHGGGLRVRHLHRHRAAARDRPDDADRRHLHGQGQVVGQVHHLAHLDPGRGLELVGGDDRPRARLHDVAVDPEVVELPLERLRVGLELLAGALERRGGRRGEQADRGQLERLRAALAEVERLLPREALVGEARLGLGRLLHHEPRRHVGLDGGKPAGAAAITGAPGDAGAWLRPFLASARRSRPKRARRRRARARCRECA